MKELDNSIKSQIGDMRSNADFAGNHGEFFLPLAEVKDNSYLDKPVEPVDPTLAAVKSDNNNKGLH